MKRLFETMLLVIWLAIVTILLYIGIMFVTSCFTQNELHIIFIPLLCIMVLALPLLSLIER